MFAIDLGGSSIKVAVRKRDTVRVLARNSHSARGEAVVAAVASEIAKLPRGPLGIAVAGIVRGGVVERSGNLGLVDFPFQKRVEAASGRSIVVLSDARAAGIAARDEGPEERIVALALGTGVGGSLLEKGTIVRDVGMGHGVTVDAPPPGPCPLGHERCLEAFLGAKALLAMARARGIEAREVADLDSSGEGRLVLADAGRLLARGLASFDAGLVVLTGGIALSSSLREAVAKSLPARVVLSRFGANAAVAGAVLAGEEG